ncbi:ATP-binding protein [Streptomyces bobili]
MAATPAAVPELRTFARQTVTGWSKGDRAMEDVALIVTELVTNACQHSGSPHVTVYLFCDERTVGVRVSDMGSWREPGQGAADDDLHGRGLTLVEAYAEAVQIRRTSTGTQVTATVLADA